LYKKHFSLDQGGLVVIIYYISMDFESCDGTTIIDDGRAIISHNYFYMWNAAATNSSNAFVIKSKVYSNSNFDTTTEFV
jgi:hypothetical protein